MDHRETGRREETERLVHIPAGSVWLEGDLDRPPALQGLVLFAHGSGSSRHSPRNRAVAASLVRGGLATLLFDLLTPEEESADAATGHHRFDIPLLAERLVAASDWIGEQEPLRRLPLGYFGASTGAAAALVAAAERPDAIRAVVSRGGRPDLAGPALPRVRPATLLIVGGEDREVLQLNRKAFDRLKCEKDLVILPGATHLFPEPGALDVVARLAREWFLRFFRQGSPEPATAGANASRF